MRVVCTAGHVDHGKSALVQALTGTDPDRFAEEKRRGLTIDLGFAHTDLPSGAVISFVDVPGHVRFLRNMLAGAGSIDACLFVVAAGDGWMPQTEEHLRILHLLGQVGGVVALTKVDLVDDETRDLHVLDLHDRLTGTFLEAAPIVPVSATSGTGLDELRAALDVLVATLPPARDAGRPRLWVDRSFAVKGSGTVVTGTLTGGAVAVGDSIDVRPAGVTARVRAIQVHGQAVAQAHPGTRVALNLTGVDHAQIARGDAVLIAAQWRPTTRFDASLDVLASLDHHVSRRGAYQAYIGSGEWPVRLRVLGAGAIAPGRSAAVRLHLDRPLPLLPGDRFVLRERGRDETVGGGEVLDVAPVLPASKAHPDRHIERVIAERGWTDVAELEALTGLRVAPVVGRWVASPETVAATITDVRRRATASGATGLDLASLDERERALIGSLSDLEIESGRVRPARSAADGDEHPVVTAIRLGGTNPPEPAGVDRALLRDLARRGLLIDLDGVWFHPGVIDAAATTVAALLREHPDGITMSQLREALATTRKYAIPLANALDARGVTRRRGDVRIGGPRLPGA